MMGQIVKRKKKGRPPKVDPDSRGPPPPERDVRRSLRRRNVKYVFDLDDYFDDDEVFEDDEDRRRREKKLKHLLKLQGGVEPESTAAPQPGRTRRVEHVPATSASSSEDGGEKPLKKRRIDEDFEEDMDDDNDDVNDEENYNDEEDEEVKERNLEPRAEDSPPGTPEEAPCGIPLPDKKTLELILDKLQKKDIYGVYAEPVDPEELPDYHDVIKNPMDFATVRSKLGNGSYATLEEFESDVFLICSNAMQYNSPDTVYHKQARNIQELAKKKFGKIRLNVGRSEKEIKPEQKMRSGSTSKKQIRRSVSRSVQEPVGSDFSSGATLATPFDMQNVSNAPQAVGYERPGSIDGLFESTSFLNDNNLDKGEESLPGKGAASKFVKKSFIHDDNRRATYSISITQPVSCSESIFSTFEEETKQLVPVGVYADYSYARSLARFAATLGSVAWKVASKRIEQALPQGYKFGRGWIGDYEPLPTPVLMLENCNVKEPPFFSKVKPASNPKKIEKIPVASDFFKDSPGSPFSLDKNLPFLGATGMRPPAPVATAPFPAKEQHFRRDVPETKPSFFLSPGMRPSGFANLNYQHQNSQPRTLESDKKIPKHVELNTTASFKKHGADPIAHKEVSKSSEMEPSRSMELRNANFSKSSEMEPSRSMEFRNANFSKSSEMEPSRSMELRNANFSKSSEMEPSRSMEFRNANFSKSSEMDPSRPMEFRNANFSKSSEMEPSGPMEFRNANFSKSSEMDPSRPMDFRNATFSKSSEMEPSRPMEFRNAKFSNSGAFKQADCNGGAGGGLHNGKVVSNRLDTNTIPSSSSNVAKPGNYYPHEQQGQGLSDPVQLMRMMAEKSQNQQKTSNNQSLADAPQLISSPSSTSNDSNNAAVAASRAWMSVGAGGFRPIGENSNNLHKNQIYADSLYNPTRSQPQISRFCGEFPTSGMHVQPDRNGSPLHPFVPQGSIPMHIGNGGQLQNQQQMVFPQFVTADLSRFQLQPTWRNISPQMHSRPKQDSLPPDLNIGFQSSGSPGRPASGVLIDSQQPDLALQL